MKRILMPAVFVMMTSGAYTADFADLAVKAAELKAAAAAEDIIVPARQKTEILPAMRKGKKGNIELQPLANGAMYSSFCNIQNKTAVGAIYNHSSDLVKFSGDIVFYYYDRYGREIANDRAHEYVAIWPTSSEKITRSGVPGDAFSCSVEAIEDDPVSLPPANSDGGGMGSGFAIGSSTYTSYYGEFDTDCSLNNGTALAVMHNHSSTLLLTYDGWMDLYYTDRDGCVLSNVSIKGRINIRPNSSETILEKSGDVPGNAVSCGITRNMDLQWSVWSER